MAKQKRGLALLSPERLKEITSNAGKSQGKWNNPGNFANRPGAACLAGAKGGSRQGKEVNPGNFANDPQRAAELGRKGGALKRT